MANFIQRKTLSGIFNAAHNHVPGANIRNFNEFVAIEIRAVLDRVHENFAECGGDILSFSVGKISDLIDELHQAFGRSHVATRREAEPLWCCGENLNAFIPTGAFSGRTNHAGERFRREGTGEKTESALTHGGDD